MAGRVAPADAPEFWQVAEPSSRPGVRAELSGGRAAPWFAEDDGWWQAAPAPQAAPQDTPVGGRAPEGGRQVVDRAPEGGGRQVVDRAPEGGGRHQVDDLRVDIAQNITGPMIRNEVRDLARSRQQWRSCANWAEGAGHIFLAAGTVAAFSAGFFATKFVAFVAGGSNVLFYALNRFSSYANRESEERTLVLNRHREFLGDAPLPDLTAGDTAGPVVSARAASA
jgi:hypothetical protein